MREAGSTKVTLSCGGEAMRSETTAAGTAQRTKAPSAERDERTCAGGAAGGSTAGGGSEPSRPTSGAQSAAGSDSGRFRLPLLCVCPSDSEAEPGGSARTIGRAAALRCGGVGAVLGWLAKCAMGPEGMEASGTRAASKRSKSGAAPCVAAARGATGASAAAGGLSNGGHAGAAQRVRAGYNERI